MMLSWIRIYSEGLFIQKKYLWGDETKTIHTITYAKMGEEMERLVCCKEMLHILHPDYLKSNTLKTVNQLICNYRFLMTFNSL